MILLALDTAGADCTAALYESLEDRLLSSAVETIGKGHAERLMAVVDAALDEAGLTLDAVGKIAVTVGPGSFTGIRVGVAAARGFALALGIEAVGVSTLGVIAAAAREAHPGRPVMAAIDARRGEIYAQLFSAAGEADGPPLLLTQAEAAELARESGALVAGSARPLLVENAEDGGTDRYPPLFIARLGASADALPPSPLYLRGPDARPQTGFAVARAGSPAA
ncbi:tRNA (adenosine(37)-N6)-threonylcarbamoyltransferase complex dimerization subunit type 1 TsaB [Rhizobiaceae bacterium BDR2-2]|uniref:tRNA (Adenosine(37)-N6)-threonylcarbamoyltransferase complex dimerization subunit type 1 TsaB n=1 Tax=Ectorhizobium quercum TaxID=2965071 RepID=A0AAE3MWM9_9HYPH|nr:tRNA (adenosine(37)-N6)-threonylcarbamoyltransferase complex dimerization subunit type 1 TsaB [Ectorhizobium quercum]MCX8995781.1 tRNA (adenosine(37)-N6)-threonylcarbamoyltransferase complex dimerization subunit type 1 TsaB [Ectorhizobium quercum]